MTTDRLTLGDLCEPVDDALPPLDRTAPPAQMSLLARCWRRDGMILLRNLIPDEPIDAYCERFIRDNGVAGPAGLFSGYGIGVPYLQNRELRDVAMHKRLGPIMDGLFGEPLGLHLNLTGWHSTQRQWHVDRMLNAEATGDWYAATWIALGDVGLDAGPFEYVPGSHKWPRITRRKVLEALGEDGSDPDWPWRSEQLLSPLYEAEFAHRGVTPTQFTASKGDVLIWSSNLVHRGSPPQTPGAERRALISHYSCLSHRPDMPKARRYERGNAAGWLFPMGTISD